jgi:hypothetical protein
MNCREFEDRIALYAGDDLPAEDAAEVERHLGQCPECARFAEEMRESQVSLKLLSNSAPGPMVRGRVMQAVDRRPGRIPWVAAAAAACVVIAAGLSWHLREPPRVEPVPIAAAPPVVIPAPPPPPPRVVPAIRKRKPKWKPEPVLLAQNTEPLVVKMLTDDPDVVIIWLVDGKEQNDEEAPLGFDGARGE